LYRFYIFLNSKTTAGENFTGHRYTGGLMAAEKMYYTMPDGTIKQVNPFTGTEVWTVPGRNALARLQAGTGKSEALETHTPEDYCDFCTGNMLKTPPEKERLIKSGDDYKVLQQVHAHELTATEPVFRRVANLFEIVTMDFWEKNYGYTISGPSLKWKDDYLSTRAGKEHVLAMIDAKLRAMDKTSKDINGLPETAKLSLANAFFAGGHELIIAGKHYAPDSKTTDGLFSVGSMTQEEHYQYMKFTIRAMQDIYEKNRYVRYISIFQNWLHAAGANIEHLHKQLVAVDEWGLSVEKEVTLLLQNENIYNEKVVNFSCYHNLVFAENDHAIALSDIGHRYPTLAVYSKSKNGRPYEHSDEEIRGFSDLVYACHLAAGSHTGSNEEWYYAPRDALAVMPWHILIKWRTHTHSGFEGGTRIYINPFPPHRIRDMVLTKLIDYRDKGLVGGFKLGDECPLKPNCLMYNRS
jgi:galactose-1-phosphate uridylyltransferase